MLHRCTPTHQLAHGHMHMQIFKWHPRPHTPFATAWPPPPLPYEHAPSIARALPPHAPVCICVCMGKHADARACVHTARVRSAVCPSADPFATFASSSLTSAFDGRAWPSCVCACSPQAVPPNASATACTTKAAVCGMWLKMAATLFCQCGLCLLCARGQLRQPTGELGNIRLRMSDRHYPLSS